ncbi:LOW QUALITY PROTEIN: B-cell receptor CD22-like [Phycodurus eques]|uniref:LOW QUALITY PROTEIN: B-cell receptor CD22-like n=1 Tax=Phycodurus eques TaxID=693459 RepID=UPI002ACD6A1B|nr:LOW QUALITY PROTEIN: B-cell receptor CD22-like [Phycodurus eques]
MEGSYTVMPGVNLTVNDLRIQVKDYWTKSLTCVTKCSLGSSPSYNWYENGEEIQNANSQDYKPPHNSKHSYSCAVRGHQHLLSPQVCVVKKCSTVVYNNRNICALKGSSVDITCAYSHTYDINTKFWFRADPSYMRINPSPPRNLQLDDRDRVEYPPVSYGRSTLRIKNVMESDSAEYRFKFTTFNFEWRSSLPGTSLTVADVQLQVMDVKVEDSYVFAWLSCHMSCSPTAPLSLCWMQNGMYPVDCPTAQMNKHLKIKLYPGEYVTCAVQGYPLTISTPLYALKAPLIWPSDPDEILERHSLTLTCRTDTQTSYRQHWYKKIKPSGHQAVGEGPELVFTSIQSSDSAEYFCTVENELGSKTSQSVMIDVKYAPKSSFLVVSPSQDIQAGQSLSLTCSCDANPAANYTWYKDNQIVLHGAERNYSFISIQSEDAGTFYCKAQNKYGNVNSVQVFINVQYGPRHANVSAIPSSSISVGSSVSLTCSSDANPNASYIWYKDNEESPKFAGAVFNISDNRQHHGGEYRCEARNALGSLNATLWLQVKASPLEAATIGCVTAAVLLILLLVAVLMLRKKMASKHTTQFKAQPKTTAESHRDHQEELVYSMVAFSKHAPTYANVANANRDQDDGVEYSAVGCSDSRVSRPKLQEEPDVSTLYSTVQKKSI